MGKNNKISRDLAGEKYNKLTITGIPTSKFLGGKKRRYVDCICECGTQVNVLLASLFNNHTQSCGCAKTTYPHRDKYIASKLMSVHTAMMQRCYNANHKSYKRYGGRGIFVCDEWHTFENFYKDMSDTWGKGFTIDRINGDDGYYKTNCRWATHTVQNRNKSCVIMDLTKVELIRKSNKNQYELSEIYNVNQSTISRIKSNQRWKN